MRKTAPQNEEMEELMEPKGFGEVGFLDHIDEAPDAVQDASYDQKDESAQFNTSVHVPYEEDHHPAHEKVEEGIEHTWNVVYEHFGYNSKKCDAPDHSQDDDPLTTFQHREAHGGVASCNEHIDHAVVQLLEPSYDSVAAVISMIDAAGKVQKDKADAEDGDSDDVLHWSVQKDPVDEDENGADEEYSCTSQMCDGIYGFSEFYVFHIDLLNVVIETMCCLISIIPFFGIKSTLKFIIPYIKMILYSFRNQISLFCLKEKYHGEERTAAAAKN